VTELLARHRATLATLLAEAQTIQPTGQGMRIALRIYLTILEDGITTLGSLINYLTP
jgi:hypothetical protein